MNRNKLLVKIISTLSIATVMLLGCIPKKSTDDLREITRSTCVPQAAEWFEENMPDAQVLSGELFGYGYGTDCSKSVEGIYSVDGEEHCYLYNCDTKEMLSDNSMDYAKEYAATIVGEGIGIDDYDDFEVYQLGFTYTVTYLENRVDTWSNDDKARTEVTKSEVGVSLGYLPMGASKDEIEERVRERLKNETPLENMWVAFFYDNRQKAIDTESMGDIFKVYPGIYNIRVYVDANGEYKVAAEIVNPGIEPNDFGDYIYGNELGE